MAKISWKKDIDKEIDDFEDGDSFEVYNGCVQYVFCCDCGLRHIYHYKIKRGSVSRDDTVKVTVWGDELGTKFFRHYKKIKKIKSL